MSKRKGARKIAKSDFFDGIAPPETPVDRDFVRTLTRKNLDHDYDKPNHLDDERTAIRNLEKASPLALQGFQDGQRLIENKVSELIQETEEIANEAEFPLKLDDPSHGHTSVEIPRQIKEYFTGHNAKKQVENEFQEEMVTYKGMSNLLDKTSSCGSSYFEFQSYILPEKRQIPQNLKFTIKQLVESIQDLMGCGLRMIEFIKNTDRKRVALICFPLDEYGYIHLCLAFLVNETEEKFADLVGVENADNLKIDWNYTGMHDDQRKKLLEIRLTYLNHIYFICKHFLKPEL